MSEINKPKSKNTENECQINPDQYQIKIDAVTAPVGSCPWAIIQAYLGNELHRSDWDTPNEYMRLTSKGEDNDFAHIEKSDKHGIWLPWQPSPEDLMACDWNLLTSETKPKPTPDNCMLSFDLKVGVGSFSDSDQNWGYLADDEFASGTDHESPFGTLTNLKNKTEITTFSYFVWNNNSPEIYLRVSSGNPLTPEGYQKLVELFKKDLTVTIDGVAYHLGGSTDGYLFGKRQYEFAGKYKNDDAQKLGTLLKQHAGNTLHFCFNWK
ncbi:Thoeris anti-defense Tad2 family protein [Xenorhabdus doucetiae]|uniref:Uncharacterized protein DUF2829 n=1 Tax=Xenorhabdus doucetiae TaxID=351671 RepID=A0A068QR31_9GAMM|nr:MW1434 family type I TA system toxin [Xenorhabdus doucetiae]TYO93322.1 uncharacterized protein DUF2829 [Xenorhabdus doucetiae]CDG16255.1 conserved protein of unknown function [Xenorhabdus doucetiae]